MHAVDEVNVSMAGRPPEDIIARGAACGGMSGCVVSAKIRFNFHDPAGDELSTLPANDQLSKQVRSDDAWIAIKELPRQNFCVCWRM